MPNPDAPNQRGYQGPFIRAWTDEIATNANPGRPPNIANYANLGILTPRGDPVAPGCRGFWGNQNA